MRVDVVGWYVLAFVVIGAQALCAQPLATIGLYEPSDCSSCRIDIEVGQVKALHLNVAVANAPGAISTAEFRVVGVPLDWMVTFLPSSGITAIGDPFGELGTVVGFSSYQQDACIYIATVRVVATTNESATLRVVPLEPTLTGFECPTVKHCMGGCDFDLRVCATGGIFHINSDGDCIVNIESTTWTFVKALYSR